MAKPVSISLSKFTASVQAAVKAATAKHPKFSLQQPHGVSYSYLIRGIPVPEEIASRVTLGETQAFAADVASHIVRELPQASAIHQAGQAGTVLSVGRHILIGIPAPPEILELEP